MPLAPKSQTRLAGCGFELSGTFNIDSLALRRNMHAFADHIVEANASLRERYERTPDAHFIEVGSHAASSNGALRQPVKSGDVMGTAYLVIEHTHKL